MKKLKKEPTCATHNECHYSVRKCINCDRIDCSVSRHSWRCDLCYEAVENALAERKKREQAEREGRTG